MNTMRRSIRVSLLGGLVALAACELDVANPNRPDTQRFTQDPRALETGLVSAFRLFFDNANAGYPNLTLATMADNLTGGFTDFGMTDMSSEPRVAFNNSPLYRRNALAEDPWSKLYEAISNVNDVLAAIEGGQVVVDEDGDDHTIRTEAFARLLQGMAYGYLALHYDRAMIVLPGDDLPARLEAFTVEDLRPYADVRDFAVARLDEAIGLAQANDFEFPGNDLATYIGVDISSETMIGLANSYAARLLAYTPRSREERATVDWGSVIARVDGGITDDFAPVALPDILESEFHFRAARTREVELPGDFVRLDVRLVGPSDLSGGYQEWLATPVEDREPFQITTPDRRVQGALNPELQPLGTYFAFHESSIVNASRGTYHRSWYYFHRLGTGESWRTGPQLLMTVDEMRLLKAEALIRLGRAAEAIPLINVTRVNNGQLPPLLTVDGPLLGADCVPRKENGECGSLWDALRYEWNFEMAGVEGGIAFYNGRGWQALVENTPVHLPVPGSELEIVEVPLYSFGGNGEGGAPPRDPEQCPVALPRCP